MPIAPRYVTGSLLVALVSAGACESAQDRLQGEVFRLQNENDDLRGTLKRMRASVEELDWEVEYAQSLMDDTACDELREAVAALTLPSDVLPR